MLYIVIFLTFLHYFYTLQSFLDIFGHFWTFLDKMLTKRLQNTTFKFCYDKQKENMINYTYIVTIKDEC